MKIFNWVHRKFHNKDGWNEEVKEKAGVNDTQSLLEQVTLTDVIDTWRQGFLTIGTFGFDPLQHFDQQKEIQLIANEENKDEEVYVDDEIRFQQAEEEEQNPLVLNAFKHGFNDNICDQNVDHVESEIVMAVDATVDSNNNLESDKTSKKGERITLADLFSADSDMQTNPDHGKVQPEAIKKPQEPHAKARFSFAKKINPPLKEGSHSSPIKKIHQMMTRMLKKKIHPDLEGKNQKKENGGNEAVSLLQTQDAIACA